MSARLKPRARIVPISLYLSMMEKVVNLITRSTQMAIRIASTARIITSNPRTISAKMGAYSRQETTFSRG